MQMYVCLCVREAILIFIIAGTFLIVKHFIKPTLAHIIITVFLFQIFHFTFFTTNFFTTAQTRVHLFAFPFYHAESCTCRLKDSPAATSFCLTLFCVLLFLLCVACKKMREHCCQLASNVWAGVENKPSQSRFVFIFFGKFHMHADA